MTAATDASSYEVASDEIPPEIQEALVSQLLASLAQATGTASASPDTTTIALPKLFRAGNMLGAVLSDIDETLDELACLHAARVWTTGLGMIIESVGPDLGQELSQLVAPFPSDPSPALLRISYQQICGWVSAVVTQEMRQVSATSLSEAAESVGGPTEVAEMSSGARPSRSAPSGPNGYL